MKRFFRNTLLAVLMLASSGLAMAIRPTHKISEDGPPVNLEAMIPAQFGDWKLEPQQLGQIVNPQVKETLERIYSQTLTRVYMNAEGEHIMLSVAYGEEQSDTNRVHYPEVCYPAQGFQVISNQPGVLKTQYGTVRVRRLLTVMGDRFEPLTYWTTLGNKVVIGERESKLEQLRYGLRGKIADGLLFRVSSITPDADAGYASQQAFVNQMIASLPPASRLRLAGLDATRPNP